MPLYIVRHCAKETDRKRFPIDNDTPLSAEGLAQIPGVGAGLRAAIDAHGHNGNVILLVSDQLRSQQTRDGIMPSLKGLNITDRTDARLREISRGTYYALNKQERMEKDPVGTARNELIKKLHPHGMLIARVNAGETVYDIYSKRIAPLMKEMRENQSPEDSVVIITSNIPARLIAMDALGKAFIWYTNEDTPGFGSIRKVEGVSWAAMKDAGYVYGGTVPKRTQAERISSPQDKRETNGPAL